MILLLIIIFILFVEDNIFLFIIIYKQKYILLKNKLDKSKTLITNKTKSYSNINNTDLQCQQL